MPWGEKSVDIRPTHLLKKKKDCTDQQITVTTYLKISTCFEMPFLKWENTGTRYSYSFQSALWIKVNIYEIIFHRTDRSHPSQNEDYTA